MGFSLYEATIPVFEQILGSVAGLIVKADAYCSERGIDPATIINARLADDMFPFAFQVKSTSVHSIGAIEGVRQGVFRPDRTDPPTTFAMLATQVAGTRATLATVTPAEVNGFVGRDMRFEAGETRRDFAAEDFLTSFSLPNVYFHATTAYALLRAAGVPVGKRDYLGKMRTRG